MLFGRVQASRLTEDKEVNYYLVGSRLYGKLLPKNKLIVIWSSSRLCKKFLGDSEVRLLSGLIQVSQQLAGDKEVNYYLVGFQTLQ